MTRGAASGLEFLEPRFSRWAHAFARLVSPLYLRFGEGVARIEVDDSTILIDEFLRFYRGETRLIIAFRHPNVSDPPVLGMLFGRQLPRMARRAGRPFNAPSFAHFLYGRGVPVWAGRVVGWLLPRLAGIPVYHRRADSRGMNAVRHAATNGRFPLALAPEGQVTYHNKAFGELEGGTGRIALWAQEDLAKAGRSEEVRILPLGLEYRYDRGAGRAFDRLMVWLRTHTGIEAGASHADAPERIVSVLLRFTEGIVARLEGAYASFYPESAEGPVRDTGDAREFRKRIVGLCDAVLRAGEAAHGLSHSGSLLDRVFRLRDAGWRCMFRDDLATLSPLERRVADTLAEEAKILAHHMELVDVLEYIDPGYIHPDASFERFLEYALNLQDLVNRVEGGTIADRTMIKGRRVVVRVGRPVSLDQLIEGGELPASAAEPMFGGRSAQQRARITDYIREEFHRLMY
ncbi:MAG: hypothetical protein GVY29_07100 [Spirochaetes bacterium]|nr:hypothetical protein [Spirochaetota bacterium]